MQETTLQKHRRIWQEKKILRVIYSEWYSKIINDLSSCSGKTVELGSGGGNFKEFYQAAIATDVDYQPWLDMNFDAHQMPFVSDSIANLVMIDTLHHLANPLLFFDEAYRVLKSGGRIIMLEPYPSFGSLIVYSLFHPEPFVMNVDYFLHSFSLTKHPWESNQAIPYLILFKHKKKFEQRFRNKFSFLISEKLSFILYPLSGGFDHPALIPDKLISSVQAIEYLLTPLKALLAFRCYVVLQKA